MSSYAACPSPGGTDYPSEEDFNQPAAEKPELLGQLHEIYSKNGQKPSRMLWASYHMASPEGLKILIMLGNTSFTSGIETNLAQYERSVLKGCEAQDALRYNTSIVLTSLSRDTEISKSELEVGQLCAEQ